MQPNKTSYMVHLIICLAVAGWALTSLLLANMVLNERKRRKHAEPETGIIDDCPTYIRSIINPDSTTSKTV